MCVRACVRVRVCVCEYVTYTAHRICNKTMSVFVLKPVSLMTINDWLSIYIDLVLASPISVSWRVLSDMKWYTIII